MSFLKDIGTSIQKNNSLLCIGLDSDIDKIPTHLLENDFPQFDFNKSVIDQTADTVCVYKINTAFYESEGENGITALRKTIEYIHSEYRGIPIIYDAKRADIGNTSEKYAKAVFEELEADAITVNPYMGEDSLEPFLKFSEKGVIVLCRTSNSGAKDFQELIFENEPLYLSVAKKSNDWYKRYGNVLLVVGATYPEDLRRVRIAAPDLFFLVPGVGAQGGNLEETMKSGLRQDGSGLLINSGRTIIFASNSHDFAEAAKQKALEMKSQINSFR